MPGLFKFLLSTIVISLSGVMAPGPVTAATIAQGTRNKNAGALIAVGHAIIEIPLIFLLMLGLHVFLENEKVKIAIGIAGGAFLIWMALQMVRDIKKPDFSLKTSHTSAPVLTGFVLSVTNPYSRLVHTTLFEVRYHHRKPHFHL